MVAGYSVAFETVPSVVRKQSIEEMDAMIDLLKQRSGKPHTRRARESERDWLQQKRQELRGLV